MSTDPIQPDPSPDPSQVPEQPDPTPEQPAETPEPQADPASPEQPDPAPEASQPPDESSPVIQPERIAPDSEGDQGFTGPGLSPAAHDPGIVSESPESAPAEERKQIPHADLADAPPPANAIGNEAVGPQPANLTNEDAVQCPVCQHRFIP